MIRNSTNNRIVHKIIALPGHETLHSSQERFHALYALEVCIHVDTTIARQDFIAGDVGLTGERAGPLVGGLILQWWKCIVCPQEHLPIRVEGLPGSGKALELGWHLLSR